MVKKIILFSTFVALFSFYYGCGPQKIAQETTLGCYPKDLQIQVNSRKMDISWKNNCPKIISGYFIYISDSSLTAKFPGTELPKDIRPFNLTAFSGDTNPDDGIEHFTAEHLENGKKYYVSVRIVFPDRSLSQPSNEVVAVCGPRDTIELSIRYKSDHDGYSFVKNRYIPADDVDNDIYFFSKGGNDFLLSPSELEGFLKENKLSKLPFKGNFNQVRKQVKDLSSPLWQDKVSVKKGDWVLLKTSDKEYALLKVLQIAGKGEKRRVKLFFAFSPLPKELIF
ncbi:MAG: hypothetical protein GXO93_00430 [FCB group bacterium]|nr:hypothetical protein [FCB group bacterium]